jgi:hypothetical protein
MSDLLYFIFKKYDSLALIRNKGNCEHRDGSVVRYISRQRVAFGGAAPDLLQNGNPFL